MSYILRVITKYFSDKTVKSFSVSASNSSSKKRFKPVDYNGELKRLDLLTGAISDYSRQDYENSTKRSKDRSLKIFRDLVQANKNKFQYFGTLTFDKNKVNRLNDDDVIKAYSRFTDNLKHKFPNICYIAVPERHKKDNALHFHMLIGNTNSEQLKLSDSGVRQMTGKNKGAIIYNCGAFKYGFTTITEIVNLEATIKYCEKYIIKNVGNSTAKCKKRFYYSNLVKPGISKEQYKYASKVDFDALGLTKVNNIFENIKYYSKEKCFLVKEILKSNNDNKKIV